MAARHGRGGLLDWEGDGAFVACHLWSGFRLVSRRCLVLFRVNVFLTGVALVQTWRLVIVTYTVGARFQASQNRQGMLARADSYVFYGGVLC